MIDQDRAAITVADRFAEIWSYTIDEDMKITVGQTGDKKLQDRFSELEKHFDDADDECHKYANSIDPHIPPETLASAKGHCAQLHDIYTAVTSPQK